MRMKLTGQQIADGINGWFADELKNGPGREYDLGKFMFSVSSGTVGFIMVAAKLDRQIAQWNWALQTGFFFLVLSILVAMFMVVPKKWSVDEKTDLFEKRDSIIRRTVAEAYAWFFVWLVGMICGVLGVLSQAAR